MTHSRLLCALLVFLLIHVPAAAQDDDNCPIMVEQALQAASDNCGDLGRGEACYGNTRVDAEPQPDTQITFDAPGDFTALAQIASLQTKAFDPATGEWGIALMSLQADLADTAPGQAVTFLLVGDVTITDASREEDDMQPMQAFYFSTGIGAPTCQTAPNNLVIQSPRGERVTLMANGATITLGSTVILSAGVGDVMAIFIIEGEGEITAAGVTVTVPAGQMTTVALGGPDGLTASGPPAAPVDYAQARIEGVPLDLLPGEIAITTRAEPCTVSGSHNVNQRSGPGTAFDVHGTLAAGESADAVEQTAGTDGFTWWRLADGSWVRSDVVSATGACETIPLVEAPEPPATPTAQPAGGQPAVEQPPEEQPSDGAYSRLIAYDLRTCTTMIIGEPTLYTGPLRAGQDIHLFFHRTWGPDLVNLTSTITVDGTPVNVTQGRQQDEQPPTAEVNVARSDDWRSVSSGTHTITITWSDGYSNTCTLVIP